jgi:hypothetical protein
MMFVETAVFGDNNRTHDVTRDVSQGHRSPTQCRQFSVATLFMLVITNESGLGHGADGKPIPIWPYEGYVKRIYDQHE